MTLSWAGRSREHSLVKGFLWVEALWQQEQTYYESMGKEERS